MKKRRLKSGRQRVILPAMRSKLPPGHLDRLQEAIQLGRGSVHYFSSRAIQQEQFKPQIEWMREKTEEIEGFLHLYRALFFCGLHLEIKRLIKECEQQNLNLVDITLQKNLYIAGAMIQRELPLAQIHLNEWENIALSQLPNTLVGLPKTWWMNQCAGALTVARLSFFLVLEGYHVYFPSPKEDVDWKIDLIAKIPGEYGTLCFQVKSNQSVQWPEYNIVREKPNGHDSMMTHRFWEGVKHFTVQHKGIYIPIEFILGPQSYEEGQLHTTGHLIDALRHMLKEAHADNTNWLPAFAEEHHI